MDNTTKMIKEKLNSKEYDFLRTNETTKNGLCYLTLGGSLSYGTNLPGNGDVDIRGIAMEPELDITKSLLDMDHFEQLLEPETDTVIYGFNKITKLLMSCNPNTIEMVGTKPEHVFYINDIGRLLRDNADAFLSQRAIGSFSGYAGQQLNRMLNALARDRLEQREKEEHILRSVKSAMGSFNERYSDFNGGSLSMYIDDSKNPELDGEIFADIDLKHYPLREFNSMLNELGSISRTYNKVNHRNHKKDDEHLNKHAMHLIRLYLMAIDILKDGKIVTYREKERNMLLDIRRGKYMNEDGTYKNEFFELQKELEDKVNYAAEHTVLPKEPDYSKIFKITETAREMFRDEKERKVKENVADKVLEEER